MPDYKEDQIQEIFAHYDESTHQQLGELSSEFHKIVGGDLATGLFVIRGGFVETLHECVELFSSLGESKALKSIAQITKGFSGTVLDLINIVEIAHNYCYLHGIFADGIGRSRQVLDQLRRDCKSQLTAFNQQLILENVYFSLR